MDPEPLPRLLLVAGVTYVTVGLVTLAIGIVFLAMESHETVVATWLVAVTDGGCATLAGGLLSSLACNQRSQRAPSFARLVLFTCVGGFAVGSQVALLVLSSLRVTKDETWREIYIFMFASAGIQLSVLVISALVLIWLTHDFSRLFKSSSGRTMDSQDNYGFLGDNDTWRRSIKGSRSPGLVRWPGVEHLESRGSSTSSAGGHYVAGDHHPKYIGPSSGDSDESEAERTAKIYADIHRNGTFVKRGNQNPSESQLKSLHPSTQLDVRSLTSRKKRENANSEFQEISSHKDCAVESRFPQRPPRKCDSFRSSLRQPSRPPVPTPRSISASPTLVNPEYPFMSQSLNRPTSRQLFLYDPVELEILSVQHKRELMQNSFQRNKGEHLVVRDEAEPDGLRSVNGGSNTGTWNGERQTSTWSDQQDLDGGTRHPHPAMAYDHLIPRTVARRFKIPTQRPNQPPPPVPGSSFRPQSPLFTVENWSKDGQSDNVKRDVTIKPQRKVTFLEAQV